MTAGPHPRAVVEQAVAAVLQVTDRANLTETLCSATAAVTGSRSVVLAEIEGETIHELARYDRTTPGLRTDELLSGLSATPPGETPAHRAREFESPRGGRAVTALGIEPASAHTFLLAEGHLADEDREAVLLLIDIAVATLDRLDSEESVRAQQARLRALGEAIRGLESSSADRAAPDDRAAEFATAAALLTDRERDILEDILQGASNASIAQRHTLSVETVKTHVKHILRKMGAANRAALIARSG